MTFLNPILILMAPALKWPLIRLHIMQLMQWLGKKCAGAQTGWMDGETPAEEK